MPIPSALVPPLFVLLWSSAFVGAKLGLPHAEPLTFLFVRFALVTLAFAAIAVCLRAPWPTDRSTVVHIAVVGTLVQGLYLSGVFVALSRGLPAGLAALIVGLQPILTALLAAPLLGERTGRRQWVGLALGLSGVALVVVERTTVSHVDDIAVALCAAALLAIAVGTIHQKRFAASMNVVTGSAIQNLAATGVTGVGALLLETWRIDWTPTFLLSLAWMTVVVSLGAFSLLMVMIRQGEAVKVASLFYMVPPTTAVLAWLAFDERIGWLGAAGIVVAACGIALIVRTRPGTA